MTRHRFMVAAGLAGSAALGALLVAPPVVAVGLAVLRCDPLRGGRRMSGWYCDCRISDMGVGCPFARPWKDRADVEQHDPPACGRGSWPEMDRLKALLAERFRIRQITDWLIRRLGRT